MLYTHFIGRIGKDAQVVNGSKGDFISMDVAVSDYYKGQETTMWVRVRSGRHVNIGKWLTKGKLILVEGAMSKPTIWQGKDGQEHVQISVTADNIQFVRTGKKGGQETGTVEGQQVQAATEAKDEAPLGAPADNKDDLPF